MGDTKVVVDERAKFHLQKISETLDHLNAQIKEMFDELCNGVIDIDVIKGPEGRIGVALDIDKLTNQ